MDQSGRRRATVAVVSVAMVPFADISDDWLTPEDLGAESLDAWRADRRAFYATCRDELALLFGDPGWRFAEEEPMTILWYRTVSDDADRQG
jgi:uncharacterized protein YhfF